MRQLRFIHLYLLVQIALPLSYYIGRDDPYDERFAWRMFSSTREVRCGVAGGPPAYTVDGTRLDLRSHFHEAWLSLAERGRQSVITAIGESLCRRYPGSAIGVSYQCRDLRGDAIAREDVDNICAQERK